MGKPLKTAQMGLKIGWCKISRNQQGRVNSMSQADRNSDMAPGITGEGLSIGTMSSASNFV